MSLVDYSKARKDLKKTPKHILAKFFFWIETVETHGLRYTQTLKGYHDEPLKGDRKGQRSIRLNKQWRAIYRLTSRNEIELIEVLEVNPHEY